MRFKLILVAVATLLVPFTLRAANRIVLQEIPGPGYLPALEVRRERQAFEAGIIDDLRRAQPAWIFIGDSMLGTRVDARHLAEISTGGTDRAHTIMVLRRRGPWARFYTAVNRAYETDIARSWMDPSFLACGTAPVGTSCCGASITASS